MNRVEIEGELVPPVGALRTEVEVALSRADPTLGSLLVFYSFGLSAVRSFATDRGVPRRGVGPLLIDLI